MNTEIAISIIVPIYNVELYLKNCINSIREQTLKNIEIICIDDGSTDKSLPILKNLQQTEKRIIVLKQENKGAGEARNLGLSIASGEYVAFMDADDWYPSNDVLEELYRVAKEDQLNVCGGQIDRVIDGQTFTLENDELRNLSGILDYKDYQFDYYFTRFIYNLKFLQKETIAFPSYRIYEDPIFLVKVMAKAEKFFLISKGVYLYRAHHKTNKWSRAKIKELILALIEMLTISKKYHLYDLQKDILNRVDKNYFKRFFDEIKKDDLEILQLLITLNELFEWDVLKKETNKTVIKVLDIRIFKGKYLGTEFWLLKNFIIVKISRLIELYKLNGFNFLKMKIISYLKIMD